MAALLGQVVGGLPLLVLERDVGAIFNHETTEVRVARFRAHHQGRLTGDSQRINRVPMREEDLGAIP